jgi:ABC-type multidrug transport system ATPase subunit
LEALMGLGTIVRGDVRLKGVSVQNWSTWQRVRAGMSLLQSRDNMFGSLTVRETLRIAKVRGIPEGLEHLEGKRMSDLSGGERQRVILTCFQYEAGELQMLDEPFLALDKFGTESFLQMFTSNPNRVHLVFSPMSN